MRILVAGGGTGGHVVPALAVSEELRKRGDKILFVGSRRPEDRQLVESAGFQFKEISAGKLRRYASLATLLEPFRTLSGIRQSRKIINQFKPDAVFAKGGYVSFPVAKAARRLKVPVIIHESDVVPGLANRAVAKQATVVAVSFPPETMSKGQLGDRVVYTGTPLAPGVVKGKAAQAFRRFNLKKGLPTVVVMGGSQGARALNQLVGRSLETLLTEVQIVHQVGDRLAAEVAKVQASLPADLRPRYQVRGFLGAERFDLYAAADLIVSRAGANTLAEVAAAGKPSIIVPLPTAASGHQEANAKVFGSARAAIVLGQESLTTKDFTRTVKRLIHDPTKLVRMGRQAKGLAKLDATKKLADLVESVARDGR